VATERWIFNRLMALCPRIPHRGLANAYFRAMGFDDVFCEGPYPMIFSGLLQKGLTNPYLIKRLSRGREGSELLGRSWPGCAKKPRACKAAPYKRIGRRPADGNESP
jgi:hypothetical protein